MKAYSAADLIDLLKDQKQFVTVDEHSITINVSYEYVIARKSCATNEAILAWIVHLCEKTWITPVVLEEFAHKAAHAAGIELPHL